MEMANGIHHLRRPRFAFIASVHARHNIMMMMMMYTRNTPRGLPPSGHKLDRTNVTKPCQARVPRKAQQAHRQYLTGTFPTYVSLRLQRTIRPSRPCLWIDNRLPRPQPASSPQIEPTLTRAKQTNVRQTATTNSSETHQYSETLPTESDSE